MFMKREGHFIHANFSQRCETQISFRRPFYISCMIYVIKWTDYDFTDTSAMFPNDDGYKGAWFWLEGPKIKVEEEYAVYSFSGIVGTVGGSLGLFIGFSFLDCLLLGVKRLANMSSSWKVQSTYAASDQSQQQIVVVSHKIMLMSWTLFDWTKKSLNKIRMVVSSSCTLTYLRRRSWKWCPQACPRCPRPPPPSRPRPPPLPSFSRPPPDNDSSTKLSKMFNRYRLNRQMMSQIVFCFMNHDQ